MSNYFNDIEYILLTDDIIDIITKHLNTLPNKKTPKKCDDCGKNHSERDKFLCIFDYRYTEDTNIAMFCRICYKYHIDPNNCKYCEECDKYVEEDFEHCNMCGDCGFPGRIH